jgi:hypothetical protein
MSDDDFVEILKEDYNKNYNYFDFEADNGDESEDEEYKNLSFLITESGEYGVALLRPYAKTTGCDVVDNNVSSKEATRQENMKSPKTGINMELFWIVEVVSIFLMPIAAVNMIQKKREEK